MSEPHSARPDGAREEALQSLDTRLDALAASRVRKRRDFNVESGSSAGYRLVAELVGSVLAGLGLGWLFDRMVGAAPLGLIVGVLGGTVGGVILVARSAGRMSAAAHVASPVTAMADDDDQDGRGD